MLPTGMAQDDDVGTVRTQGALRYSFLEIKEAQRVCGETMTAAALRECGAASFAQQQIFRAHVNDLCATVFAAALRKYNPENKEEMAPVDEAMATTLKQLEMKVKEEEATVKKLQKHVSRMAVSNTRRELAKARKRHADVLVTAPASSDKEGVELTAQQVKVLKTLYLKTASSVAITSARLSQATAQTTETIKIVEEAMKRPKTTVDAAMETSPVKPNTLLNEQENNHSRKLSPLRTRLALELSASKTV